MQENTVYNEKKNQPIDIDPKMVTMIELIDETPDDTI